MAVPNYIQKMIDEYNAQNTPEVLIEKEKLENEIINFLNNFLADFDPVFKEFSDNPLKQMPYKDLNKQTHNFSKIVNKSEQTEKAASMLIVHLCHYLVYKSFCSLENTLRNKNVEFKDTYSYAFILTDLVDDAYVLTSQLDMPLQEIFNNAFYLAFKDYLVTFVIPIFDSLQNYRPKKHTFSSYKNNLDYSICEAQKKFILQDELLSQQYKNFVYNYKISLRNSKLADF